MKVKMLRTVPWQRGQFLAIGQEVILPNDAAVMLIKRGVAQPAGVIPPYVQKQLGEMPQPKTKRHRR